MPKLSMHGSINYSLQEFELKDSVVIIICIIAQPGADARVIKAKFTLWTIRMFAFNFYDGFLVFNITLQQ